MKFVFLSLLTIGAASVPAVAQVDPLTPTGTFSIYENAAAAPTPPMGWNPWNAFRTDVDEDKVRGSARALVSTGLARAGYRYVNIDDGWALQRLADGRIKVRTSMFPSAAAGDQATGSLLPFTQFIHDLGLKAGIYSDIGVNTCAQRWDASSPNLPEGTVDERQVGSFGHSDGDMHTVFADWKFDYIKVDACGVGDYGPGSPPVVAEKYRAFPLAIVRGDLPKSDPRTVESLYAALGTAISRWGGADAVLSICAWGEALSPVWGHKRGNLWRTSPDIEFTWASMLRNVDSAIDAPLYAGPGRWNDPDMLAIGHGDFDEHHLTEARAHFSMWAIMSAPLLLGFDLRNAPPALIELVGNPEVIAIDQDPAGNQGIVRRSGQTMVVVKMLTASGARAVVFLNRGDTPATATVDWAALGYAPGSVATVRDAGLRRALPDARDRLTVTLPPHGSILARFTGTPADAARVRLDQMTGRINVAADGLDDAAALPVGQVPVRVGSWPGGDAITIGGREQPDAIGAFANSRLEIRANGEFRRFTATPIVRSGETVMVRVYADRRLVKQMNVEPGGLIPLDAPVRRARIVELVAAAQNAQGRPPMVAWTNAAFIR